MHDIIGGPRVDPPDGPNTSPSTLQGVEKGAVPVVRGWEVESLYKAEHAEPIPHTIQHAAFELIFKPKVSCTKSSQL